MKSISNWGVYCFVSCGSFFSVSVLCSGCMWCFVSSVLVVSSSAIDCLEKLVSEMVNYVSSGTLNPTVSLTHLHIILCLYSALSSLFFLFVLL